MTAPSPLRTTGFRFRFSLRTLLIGTVLLSFVAAWYGGEWHRIWRQRAVVQELHANLVTLNWDYQRADGTTMIMSQPPPGSWFRRALFGDDGYSDVNVAYLLTDSEKTDASLALLPNFPKMKIIVVGPGVTSVGLQHIARNPQLAELLFVDVKITSEWLATLERLPRLKRLHLSSDEIGDNELQGIENLTQLEDLNFSGTKVTSRGLTYLRNLKELRELDFHHTVIGDDGLAALKRLVKLEYLAVGPNVTAAAAKNLQQQLPNCEIRGYSKTGLVNFELKRGG